MTANVEELGKITASKEILNDIAIAYGASRDFYRRIGCNALADRCSKLRFYSRCVGKIWLF